MEPLSRSLLMSVGVIKNTLTDVELAEFTRTQQELAQEREAALVLDEKTGFELGWDYGRYLGWHPEDEHNKHFLGGFDHAKENTWKPHNLDRYTRKWLQLRYGAWRRNRVFDENVTPAFLEDIDRPLCPILGISLTHSTGELTDWSVDRLNNQAGYAVGNLAVMSTQANAAKSNLSLDEIITLSELPMSNAGLTPLHWKRLASLLTGPYSVIQETELLHPLCLTPPPFVPLTLFQELQLVLARESTKQKSALMHKLLRLCATYGYARQFKKVFRLVAAASDKREPVMELWLQNAPFAALLALYQRLPAPALDAMRLLIEQALGSEQMSHDMRQRWALDNKGFT